MESQSVTSNLASEPQDRDQVLDHFPEEEEESATSDLLVDLNAKTIESMELSDAVFIPAQLAAIQDTVSSTVQAAFQLLPHNDALAFSSTPKSSCFSCSVSERPQSPLGQSTVGQNTPR